MFATRTVIVSLLARHRDHAAREHPARAAGDPRAADRRRPRGRDACPPSRFAGALAKPASASSLALARRDRRRHVRRRRERRRRRRCCSAAACSGCSSASRCWRRGSSSRSPASSAGRRAAPAASPASWPGANAVRNPGRTASTAAALMIGLTLVTVVAVLGAGISAATQVGDHRPAPRRLRHRRQRGPAVPGRRGRQAGGDRRA